MIYNETLGSDAVNTEVENNQYDIITAKLRIGDNNLQRFC